MADALTLMRLRFKELNEEKQQLEAAIAPMTAEIDDFNQQIFALQRQAAAKVDEREAAGGSKIVEVMTEAAVLARALQGKTGD